MNEDPAPKSTLDLTLIQHLYHEDFEPRKLCVCFEVDPTSSLILSHFSKLSHLSDFVAT